MSDADIWLGSMSVFDIWVGIDVSSVNPCHQLEYWVGHVLWKAGTT